MSKKKYYVCIEFSKDCMRKYFYQYTNNKLEAVKLLSTLKKQNKTVIGWIDFIWNSEIEKKIPESVLHGKLYIKTDSLLQEIA